jgi:PleD family two-component response regulator
MRTFLINSERSPMAGMSGNVSFPDAGIQPMSFEVLDLETFTHCAPILISDYEPQITRLYEVLMSRLKLRTVSVPDGKAALEYMLKKPVSLVISEIAKPHVSGLEMLKALRQDPTTTDVPFIMITSDPQYETRAAFKALGGNAYLTKPLNTKQFTQTVVQLLSAELSTESSQ